MIARVAQLYYEDRLKQAEISERLHVSQATVSRLLKRAEAEGIVRVTIVAPRGTYPEIEVGPAPALSPQRGDRHRVLRRSGRRDPLGHRRRRGALLRNDDE